ncbi:MAG: hypothetical protein V1904_03290 [Bacteroidota bacterium]
MKNTILKNKSKFISVMLKLMGVCGVLILFEACYGTPKSAFVPKHDLKNKNTASANHSQQKETTSLSKR